MKRSLLTLLAGTATLAAALSPLSAHALGGLVVKLRDGSTPVDQPDLFASALTQAWGDGSRFCAALKAQLPAPDSPSGNGVVTSCTPVPYGVTEFIMAGRTPLLLFSGKVTLQGTSPFLNGTNCPFTETVSVSLQAPLTIKGDMLTIREISFSPPTVTGRVDEVWAGDCNNSSPSRRPGGLSSMVKGAVPIAASDAGFPGNALNDALSPFGAPMKQALSAQTYTPSAATGDAIYTVTGSVASSSVSASQMHPLPETSTPKPNGSAPTPARLHSRAP